MQREKWNKTDHKIDSYPPQLNNLIYLKLFLSNYYLLVLCAGWRLGVVCASVCMSANTSTATIQLNERDACSRMNENWMWNVRSVRDMVIKLRPFCLPRFETKQEEEEAEAE